ncbi:lipoprotein YhcN [Thalassobacillus devorans]|uniref:Lipoprotein YhcN n=1 Tax=Thalassobacillus devorans TaxID=279813 RepID=A0ABQ1PST9_9BACI|nr:YhcN/YlaJ family sporulation lipoprotein [Thalassobacillus devorans]NIK30640.1 YhcN/YlaJ family sporulation lipoprotein [Thalassobacillus devorans]GGD02607.1 lipoprotein YhcN [Thalassobacillus devorans]
MKLKAIALGLLASSALVACQANDEGARNDNTNDGVENTRFERNAEDMANRDNNMNVNDRGNNNYEVAEQAAQTIADKVEGVERANVLTTRNNAYVAVVMDGQEAKNNNSDLGNQMNNAEGVRDDGGMDIGENEDGDVSDEMKKKIADIVKNQNNDIDNVYVSANADFADLTDNYVNDVDRGEPVEGFFRQFGEMVDRIFPDAE